MGWLKDNMTWIMIVSGILTCTMFYAAINPRAALRFTFGETLEGPVANIVVRNWGALIGLVGAMLIYGAFHQEGRTIVLMVAGVSKLIFIGLVLSQGKRFLSRAGVAIAADSIMVALYGAYLLVGQES